MIPLLLMSCSTLSVSSYISVCQWDDYSQVSTVWGNQHLWSHALHVLRSAISLISTGTLPDDEKFLDTGKCRELWDLERHWDRSLSKWLPASILQISAWKARGASRARMFCRAQNPCLVRLQLWPALKSVLFPQFLPLPVPFFLLCFMLSTATCVAEKVCKPGSFSKIRTIG